MVHKGSVLETAQRWNMPDNEREKLGGVHELYALSRDLTDDKPLKAPAFVKHPGKNWRGYGEYNA